MKVLFDNNVPAPLRYYLVGHEVRTAAKLGWQERENGDLLAAAQEAGFDVMVTGDKNLSYQKNLTVRTLALVVLDTTRWKTLRDHTAPVAAAVDRAKPGSVEYVQMPGVQARRRDPFPAP